MFLNNITRSDYLSLTSLVSKAFSTKLGKTRHRIAQYAGFKNSSALESTLNKSVPVDVNSLIILEEYDFNLCTSNQNFSYVHINNSGKLVIHSGIAPLYVQIILQGATASTARLLTERFWIQSCFESYDENGNETKVMYQIFSIQEGITPKAGEGRSFYLATLLQRVKPSSIVTNQDILMAEPALAGELIEHGSIEQYNWFLTQPQLVNSLGLSGDISLRYKKLIDSTGMSEVIDQFNYFGLGFNEIYLPEEILCNVNAPPLYFRDNLPKCAKQEPFYAAFYPYMLMFIIGDGGYNNFDRDVAAIYLKAHKKEQALTDFENAFIGHCKFCLECLSEELIDGLHQNNSELLSDVLNVLSTAPVLTDSISIMKLLSWIPSNGIYEHSHFMRGVGVLKKPSEFNNWFNAPIIAHLTYDIVQIIIEGSSDKSLNKNLKAQAQHIFSSLPDELLDLPFDISEYVDDDHSIYLSRSCRDMLLLT